MSFIVYIVPMDNRLKEILVMSKFQRNLQHVILVDLASSADHTHIMRDVTNHTIYDYWSHTPVFEDYISVCNVPSWQMKFIYNFSYTRICRYTWFKNLCHNFRAYLMRHFYCAERRDCLEKFSLTYTKGIDFQRLFDI